MSVARTKLELIKSEGVTVDEYEVSVDIFWASFGGFYCHSVFDLEWTSCRSEPCQVSSFCFPDEEDGAVKVVGVPGTVLV